MYQPRSFIGTTRIRLGLMINTGMLLPKHPHLRWIRDRSRINWEKFVDLKCELIKPTRTPSPSLVSEKGSFLWSPCPFISGGLLLSLLCSTRVRHFLRVLVGWWTGVRFGWWGHPSGPRHLAPAQQDRATESGNKKLWHMTHIWDQSFRAQQYIILRRTYGYVIKVPGQTPHITTKYSADSRNRRRGLGLVSTSRNRSLRQA